MALTLSYDTQYRHPVAIYVNSSMSENSRRGLFHYDVFIVSVYKQFNLDTLRGLCCVRQTSAAQPRFHG